jgi:hypothetical protein
MGHGALLSFLLPGTNVGRYYSIAKTLSRPSAEKGRATE